MSAEEFPTIDAAAVAEAIDRMMAIVSESLDPTALQALLGDARMNLARVALDRALVGLALWADVLRILRTTMTVDGVGSDRELAAAERASDAAYQSLAAALLSRWPVLDDAYHPAFERTLADAGPRIEEALSTWPEVRAFSQAERRLRVVDARYSGALVEESTVLRLLRARETLALAATLQARGGPDLAHFERLLACERYVPPRP